MHAILWLPLYNRGRRRTNSTISAALQRTDQGGREHPLLITSLLSRVLSLGVPMNPLKKRSNLVVKMIPCWAGHDRGRVDVVLDPGSRPQTILFMEESARGRESWQHRDTQVQVKAGGEWGSHDVYSQMTTNSKIPPLRVVCQKTARERWTEWL